MQDVFVRYWIWLYVETKTDRVEGLVTEETIEGADAAVSRHGVTLDYSCCWLW